MSTIARRAGMALAVLVSTVSASLAASPSASAAETVELEIAPGASKTIQQSVETPFLPPKPDIVLVIDRTGSMGPAVTDVKQKIANVVATVQSLRPAARFAVVAYCEQGEEPFRMARQLSGSASAVIDSVINLPLCHGGDLPEAQMDALWRVGNGAVAFREDSNPIIAWFGDAPGHANSGGHNEGGVIRSFKKIGARVVAVSVGRDQLDAYGQASRITRATGGTFTRGVSSGGLASSLLAGITSLEVEVTAKPQCSPGLKVTLAPRQQDVASGKSAKFTEKVTVAANAKPGSTLRCTIPFSIEERTGSLLKQEIIVNVPESDEPSEEPTDPTPDAPEAVNDELTVPQDATLPEDADVLTFDVLANDRDRDLVTSLAITTPPVSGTAKVTDDNTVTYEPEAGYCNASGEAPAVTFAYTLTPGGSAADVTVTVTCADDVPTDGVPTDDEPTDDGSGGTAGTGDDPSPTESNPPPTEASSSSTPGGTSASASQSSGTSSESAGLSDDASPNGPDPTP